MSRRKDRERFLAEKAQDPNYQGFRGYDYQPPAPPAAPPSVAITCSSCGRRRNVSSEIAQAEGDKYVCLSCQEESGTSSEDAAQDTDEEKSPDPAAGA